jgi:hypothetical protein
LFQRKRSDTLVSSIENDYGLNLNARSDALLGNLLRDRGFESLSQLIDAYRGRLTYHPAKRKIFLSFHAEDLFQVNGFRLMARNPSLTVDFNEMSSRDPVRSERSSYIRQAIREKISRSAVLVCLIGNGTAWRDWVEWEIATAIELRKGVCGVRLKGSFGRTPAILAERGAPIAKWNMSEIVAAIESAAARRS